MCTLLIWNQVYRDHPVVIAANRDEYRSRAAMPPAPLPEAPHIIAGRDLKGGGSWMGATTSGFFVGLTNQRFYHQADETLRSRGEVVMSALKLGNTDEVIAYLQSLDARAYNAFNLLFGDAQRLNVAYARSERPDIQIEEVSTGFHVLPNDILDSASFPKVLRAKALASGSEMLDIQSLIERAHYILADHQMPRMAEIPDPPAFSMTPKLLLRHLEALCVHLPFYGTRSSTIAALQPKRVSHYLYADGSPCCARFRDLSDLFYSERQVSTS